MSNKTQVSTDDSKINELTSRSVDTIYPSAKALQGLLKSGKQLTVYVGIDPTADYVHLGHSTNYIVLKRFHDLGHKVIVLVGDFTAKIGDPSDKTSLRVQLSDQQVKQNLKTFKDQIGKILSFEDPDNPIEFKFNSQWLAKLSFADAVELASNFTVQQMVERDAFQKRLAAQKPLYVHEFFYPLMQGYDSVAMDVDVEVGGTDQTFNMLAGRTLLKRLKDKEKIVIATTLLENPVTGEKLMSKSLGTGVGLNESPVQMFGKVMALPDEGLVQCFVDCTYVALDQIETIKKQLATGVNPRDIKLRLASTIVEMYHSAADAEEAQQDWLAKFSSRDKDYVPEDATEVSLASLTNDDPERFAQHLIIACGVCDGFSQARRLVEQGAYKINGVKVTNLSQRPKVGDVVQIGKKHYFKIVS